jgi:phospholipase C
LVLCSSVGHADDGDRGNHREDTRTPIKHVVVIIPENRTFDNFFATYPHAANIAGEQSWLGVPAPKFVARPGTPAVNGLTPALLQNNPNRSLLAGPANPTRLRPADAYTCDMAHNYEPEQQAYNGGAVDRFPQTASGSGQGCAVDGSTIMNYYDGNTVQALWNYAGRLCPATPISLRATRMVSSFTTPPTPPAPTPPVSTSIRRINR